MRVSVYNRQRTARVDTASIKRMAECALARLNRGADAAIDISFIGKDRMRALNRGFKGRDWFTDVLSFRYDEGPLAGEVVIDPSRARDYARDHGVPYEEELSRYVYHGLLHWVGLEDRTDEEKARMRREETKLMRSCGVMP